MLPLEHNLQNQGVGQKREILLTRWNSNHDFRTSTAKVCSKDPFISILFVMQFWNNLALVGGAF